MSFIYTNPNPLKRNVGDCTVRAISICEGLSWEEVYLSLCIMGFLEGDMPSSNEITDKYLLSQGYTKKGIVNNPCNNYAHYQVTFNGNIAIPEGGTVAPIAIALTINGEPRLTSRAIFTPSAVEEYGNVTAIIKVPKGCCYNLSIDAVPASTTTTPAPVIEIQNANLTIARIA